MDLEDDVTAGFDLISTWDLDEHGIEWIAKKVKQRVGTGPVVISLDVDVMDPSYVPASEFLYLSRHSSLSLIPRDLSHSSPIPLLTNPFDHLSVESEMVTDGISSRYARSWRMDIPRSTTNSIRSQRSKHRRIRRRRARPSLRHEWYVLFLFLFLCPLRIRISGLTFLAEISAIAAADVVYDYLALLAMGVDGADKPAEGGHKVDEL